MGIANTDLNADRYPDYFLTSMADNKLQMLADIPKAGGRGQPSYVDLAFAKGVTAHRPYTGDDPRPSTAWHAEFEDVNNDGRVDLFIAKGNVGDMPDFAARDPNNLLLQTDDGTFREAGEEAGVASFATSRGGALTDFNLDGLVDLVVVNRGENAKLWRNTTRNAGGWIEIGLKQPAPNPDAIGAWLEVRSGTAVMRREITVGGGHASGENGFWHFGLGARKKAELRAIWPDGSDSGWHAVEGHRFYVLERGKAPQVWMAK
jgi:hypothetical protein